LKVQKITGERGGMKRLLKSDRPPTSGEEKSGFLQGGPAISPPGGVERKYLREKEEIDKKKRGPSA